MRKKFSDKAVYDRQLKVATGKETENELKDKNTSMGRETSQEGKGPNKQKN